MKYYCRHPMLHMDFCQGEHGIVNSQYVLQMLTIEMIYMDWQRPMVTHWDQIKLSLKSNVTRMWWAWQSCCFQWSVPIIAHKHVPVCDQYYEPVWWCTTVKLQSMAGSRHGLQTSTALQLITTWLQQAGTWLLQVANMTLCSHSAPLVTGYTKTSKGMIHGYTWLKCWYYC